MSTLRRAATTAAIIALGMSGLATPALAAGGDNAEAPAPVPPKVQLTWNQDGQSDYMVIGNEVTARMTVTNVVQAPAHIALHGVLYDRATNEILPIYLNADPLKASCNVEHSSPGACDRLGIGRGLRLAPFEFGWDAEAGEHVVLDSTFTVSRDGTLIAQYPEETQAFGVENIPSKWFIRSHGEEIALSEGNANFTLLAKAPTAPDKPVEKPEGGTVEQPQNDGAPQPSDPKPKQTLVTLKGDTKPTTTKTTPKAENPKNATPKTATPQLAKTGADDTASVAAVVGALGMLLVTMRRKRA